MNLLDRPWYIEVNSKHRPCLFHCVFVCDEIIGDWHTELQYAQLDITCLSDVSVHVNLVVEKLLVLYHKTFVGSVFVTLQRVEKFLCYGQNVVLFGYQFLLALETDGFVDNWKLVLKNFSILFLL